LYATRKKLNALTEANKRGEREDATPKNVEVEFNNLKEQKLALFLLKQTRVSFANRESAKKENKRDLLLRKLQVFDYRKIEQHQDVFFLIF
jgi:hypothetical protein